MKLLVIVLCLLSERFLVHSLSHNRFYWFSSYFNALSQRLPKEGFFAHPGVLITAVLLPILFVCWLALFILGHLFYGFIGLLLNLAIFYYCLGPENPFYPVSQENESDETVAGNYFIKANNELFAVVFWYIVAGPLAILVYRLVSLCRGQELTAKLAQWLTNVFDWIPARITVLLYLLVGNFQQGFRYFMQTFFSAPENNDSLLSQGGLLAAHNSENESVQVPYAESLVEHALIVFLVFLAVFTLGAWL